MRRRGADCLVAAMKRGNAKAQTYTAYAAGVSAKAKASAVARAMLKFITDPAAASALKAGGMESG
jgi:hypothetical protein